MWHYACMHCMQNFLTAIISVLPNTMAPYSQSTTHFEGLSRDSSLLRPLTSSQIHQIQLAGGCPLLPFSQHANLTVDREHCVWSWWCCIQRMACCRSVSLACTQRRACVTFLFYVVNDISYIGFKRAWLAPKACHLLDWLTDWLPLYTHPTTLTNRHYYSTTSRFCC